MKKKKRSFNFILVLEGISNPDTDIADIFFDSGCSDATLSIRDQVAYLEFDRKSNSLQDAIVSAVRNVLDTGLEVRINAIEPGDYVTTAEIARRLNLSRQYIQLLKSGNRGSITFPAPISGIQSGILIYSWARILFYFYEINKSVEKEDVINAQIFKLYNDILDKTKYLRKDHTDKHILKQFNSNAIIKQIIYP